MKKISAIIIFVILATQFAVAQDYEAKYFELDGVTGPTVTTTYTARDSIILSAGFDGDGTNGSITLGINEELIFSMESGEYVSQDAIENRDIDKSLDFGSLPGSFNVSSSGAASYSIPIYAPPGAKGSTPSLSVLYNSSMHDGLLGTAWTLSGSSTIHRMGKNFFEDDSVVDGINLDATDVLAIDGNRLVKVNDSTYRTKFESYRIIKSYGTTGNGPSYFKVTDNKGNIYEYGNSSDSKIEVGSETTLLGWKLNKVTDPNGNYMTYEYDNSVSGQAYLKNIKYSGNSNASLEPYNEIKILYQIRADEKIKYLKGEQTEDNYLVRKIQVESFENKLREYQFNYSTTKGRTFLSEIIVENSEGEQYNSTIVGWNDFADTIMIDSSSTFYYTDNARFGDFNGDGYNDYVGVLASEPGHLPEFTTRLYLNDGSGGYSTYEASMFIELETYVDHFVGDFNGDGTSDVVLVSIDDSTWVDSHQKTNTEEFYKLRFLSGTDLSIMRTDSTSTSFDGLESIDLPFEYDKDSCSRFFVTDINSDGLSDFAVAYYGGMIIKGATSWTSFTKSNKNFPVGADENFLTDFTGDRVPDYATFEDDTIKIYDISGSAQLLYSQFIMTYSPNPNHYFTGDFNGDGIMDLYYESHGTEWKLRYGTGTGFTSDSLVHESDYSSSVIDYFDMVLDFNSDGMDDIITLVLDTLDYPYTEGWLILFRESIGDGNFRNTSCIETDLDFNFQNTQVSDANGDGFPDLLTLNENRYFMYNPNDEHMLVDFIENGIGSRTTIDYSTLLKMKDDTTYLQNGSFTFPQQSIINPLTVVESFEVTSSLHNDASITKSEYTYTDAVIHKQGLGFLGFGGIDKSTDAIHTSKSYSSFRYPDYYASIDSVEYYYNQGSTPIKSSVYERGYHSREVEDDSTYIIYTDKVLNKDYLNGNTTTTDPTIDSLGNLSSTKTTSEDGSYQETLYYNYLNEGSKFPKRVVKNVKHKDDTNIFSSETRLAYDAVNFQVDTIIENYGKSNQIVTYLSQYDDFGNANKIEIEPDSLTKKTVTYDFDETGRFQTLKTTSLGEVSISFDPLMGYLLFEENIYGDSVSYQYNNWGVLLETIFPFGNSKIVTVDWAENSDPSGTLYSVNSQVSLGTYSKHFIDYKGRLFKSENEGFQGNIYYSETKYNQFNQVDSSSNIYISSGSPLWNTFKYQSTDGRISNELYIGGAEVDYTYSTNGLEKKINSSREYTYESDALGNITSIEDPLGNTLSYTYNSTGSFKTVVGNGGTLSNFYNDAGIDTTSTDPSLGTMEQRVNAFGQPTWIKDGKGNEFDFSYDTLYRVTRKENSHNSSEYYSISYVASGNGKGQVSSKSYTDGKLTTTLSYTYDTHGRVKTESKLIGSKIHTLSYRYDGYGRLDSITDSNGKQFDYRYDNLGYMNKIYFEGDLIWELTEQDLTERSENLGSNISVTSSFNSFGQLTSIESGDLFDMSYSFCDTTGNLLSRTQRIFNESGTCIDTLSESFTYDDLDRLLQITGPVDTLVINFDSSIKERIDSKSDAGEEYKYSASNKFQLTSIDSATSLLTNRPNMSISYTSFSKVDTIVEGDYLINFDYGPNAERVKMEVKYKDTLQYTRYYFGSYELTEYPGEDDEKKTWFSSGSGIFGFNRVIDTSDHNFYILKDHLGSVMTVANEDGGAEEFFSYDAWGRRRNDSTWVYDSTMKVEYTSRGYTGHEHIDETCLINMNGRVYDPMVGLFLSPDPILQEPLNPLNYNRYTYVLNNPLKYTDPSGYKKLDHYEIQELREEEASYLDMMRAINEAYEMAYRPRGGGGGYEHINGQYYKDGQPVPYQEFLMDVVKPNSVMAVNYVQAAYYMKDASTAVANLYWEYSILQNPPPDKVNLLDNPLEGFIEWFHYLDENRSYHYRNGIAYNVNDIVDENSVKLEVHLKNGRLNQEVNYKGYKVEWNIPDFEFFEPGHYNANFVDSPYADIPCRNLYRITLLYNNNAKIVLTTASYEAWTDLVNRIFGDNN